MSSVRTSSYEKREDMKPGDTLLLVSVIDDKQWPYDPDNENTFYPAFLRFNRDNSYTSVLMRGGTPLTIFCACHPVVGRFGWIAFRRKPGPGLGREAVMQFIDGEVILLKNLRATHSCVTAKVW